ncbi:hypothetical protein [Streptacidiphilus carbonis]|uniref:hypothetical protein n=1 Tax=Streptacidiphilus carbonis TaxID=105422 RepID=UPI0005AA3EEA|nr:hypothetical protein [Streptacidiphilus carbonis]
MTISDDLTVETLEARRAAPEPTARVIFGVTNLYGISHKGMDMPLNSEESIKSGQIVLMLDPASPPQTNMGIADFDQFALRVRYGVQGVFPGLHDLVLAGGHSPSLLAPIRATATDDCTIEPDLSGWHARGCLEFLPGSMWSGAKGG